MFAHQKEIVYHQIIVHETVHVLLTTIAIVQQDIQDLNVN
jgi:hypothetical protein